MKKTATVLVIFSLVCCILLPGCSSAEPKGYRQQYDLGLSYLSEGNYEEAVIAFTAAIELDPRSAPAYLGRAEAYVRLEEYELAAADYRIALELDDDLEAAREGLDFVTAILDEAPGEDEDGENPGPETAAAQDPWELYHAVLTKYREVAAGNYSTYDEYISVELRPDFGPRKLYCAFVDMDGNGVPELFVAGLEEGNGEEYTEVYDVYTHDGEPVRIFEENFGYRSHCMPGDDGVFILWGSGGAFNASTGFYRLSSDGRTPELIESLSVNSWSGEPIYYHDYDEIDEISEDEYERIRSGYPERDDLEWFPLFEADNTQGPHEGQVDGTLLGAWYSYGGSAGEGYEPVITFNDDGTFHFYVNLFEGMGNVYGTYAITGDTIECSVSSRDFGGFRGDDVNLFHFTVSGSTLAYTDDIVGTTQPGDIFERQR